MQVLVTGAAGLIGRALCTTLAARGHGVVALARHGRATGNGMAPPWSGCLPEPGRVVLLTGDVTEIAFGVASGDARLLQGSLDVIVHCAAVTAFNLEQSAYDRVNVGGVATALAFAAAGDTPFLHVSTAYVCGTRKGVIAEAPSAGPFANLYEASKAAGEVLVQAARRCGRRVAIARPSIVIGGSRDGAIGAFTNVYQLIRLIAEGRIRTLPASPEASLDLVPIDHVTDALADLAERMTQAAGLIVHVASGSPVSLDALLATLNAYPHLHVPALVAPERFDPGELSERERWLSTQVTSLYAGYLQRSPLFETRNLPALTGRVCPPTDDAYLRRTLDFAIAAGFLAAPQRTSG